MIRIGRDGFIIGVFMHSVGGRGGLVVVCFLMYLVGCRTVWIVISDEE